MCLALATDAPAYDFELTGVARSGERVSSTPFSYPAWLRLLTPEPLPVSMANQAVAIARLCEADEVVKKGLAMLQDAHSLMAVQSVAPVSAFVLISLFRAIELVSDHMAQGWREDHREGLEEAQGNVAVDLCRELSTLDIPNSAANPRARAAAVAAVVAAAKSIEKLREAYQADEIRRAARLLAISDDECSIALEMNSVRNRVAHPGREDAKTLLRLTQPGAVSTMSPGERAARAFVNAYVARLQKPG
ncbi:MAG: hypothetical protein PHU43_01165 [Candidatus Bipolaricaulis sp.]|nr:hypothetical protein [Candidatus Bipolaricaulis sp.]